MEFLSEQERYEERIIPHDLNLSSEEHHLIQLLVDKITSKDSDF